MEPAEAVPEVAATAASIRTLRDDQERMVALVLRHSQHVVVTVPSIGEGEGVPGGLYTHHRRLALRALNVLCNQAHHVRVVRGRMVSPWKLTRPRKLAVTPVVKVVLVIVGTWLSIWLIAVNKLWMVLICSVAGGIIGLVPFVALIILGPMGALRMGWLYVLYFVFVYKTVKWLAIDTNMPEYEPKQRVALLFVTCIWSAVLLILEFWNCPSPGEEVLLQYDFSSAISVSTDDGLLRTRHRHPFWAVPLSCVQSFRTLFFQRGEGPTATKLYFLVIDKGESESWLIWMASARIAELVAVELNEALRRWRALHGAPLVVRTSSCRALLGGGSS